jgi:CSLREA domain-containing protein
MSLFTWLRNRPSTRAPGSRAQRRPAAARFRPRLETLEGRWLPSQVALTVTTLADEVDPRDNVLSLREAILAANAGSQTDKFTINVAVSGTIDLFTPLPHLDNNIAIQGPGASSLTVERAAGVHFSSPVAVRIITVDAGQTASLSGLTIANGDGGGILNNRGATLTVSGCALSGNSNSWNSGGGIENGGTLTVSSSTLSGNSSFGEGGGIDNYGTLTVSGCTLIGNSSARGGGGIDSEGTATVTDSTLSGNSSPFGGGISTRGTLTVSGSTLSGNSAIDGGGILSAFSDFPFTTSVTITGCTLSGNSASRDGGGVYGVSLLTIRDCLLTGNSAAGRGGGISTGGEPETPGTATITGCTLSGNSASVGGAIFNQSFLYPTDAVLVVRGCTFSGNTASDKGGAIYTTGTATLKDSTLSGNTAGADGGGIFNAASGILVVKDSTVLNNVAPLGADIYNLGALTLDDSTVGVIGP